MNIEIVSHCWHYSRLLNYQLSSLLEFPPVANQVTMSVFFTREDEATSAVVDYFRRNALGSHVQVIPRELPRAQLMRREIGRNIAALESNADWIWFTDCDFCFGPDAIDSIPAAVAGVDSPLCFPARIAVTPTHALGDSLIQSLTEVPVLAKLPIDQFKFGRIRYAFGGVQLVRGEVAREKGYLRHSPKLRRGARTWRRTFSDKQFRRSLGTRGVPVEIPNVFRIRHSQAGRFNPAVQN